MKNNNNYHRRTGIKLHLKCGNGKMVKWNKMIATLNCNFWTRNFFNEPIKLLFHERYKESATVFWMCSTLNWMSSQHNIVCTKYLSRREFCLLHTFEIIGVIRFGKYKNKIKRNRNWVKNFHYEMLNSVFVK